MSEKTTPKEKGKVKVRLMPNQGKGQSLKKALEETNKQYAETLRRLADS